MDTNIRVKIESDIKQLLTQLKTLEDENERLKREAGQSQFREQFEKNFVILESKYTKQFKKYLITIHVFRYMKCLFKYGIY